MSACKRAYLPLFCVLMAFNYFIGVLFGIFSRLIKARSAGKRRSRSPTNHTRHTPHKDTHNKTHHQRHNKRQTPHTPTESIHARQGARISTKRNGGRAHAARRIALFAMFYAWRWAGIAFRAVSANVRKKAAGVRVCMKRRTFPPLRRSMAGGCNRCGAMESGRSAYPWGI